MVIKLFEEWSRYPKSIDMDDWLDKQTEWNNGGSEPFDKQEIKYINELIRYNSTEIHYSELSESDFAIGIRSESIDIIRYIEVYKMKDSWYLLFDDYSLSMSNKIQSNHPVYYLCDEFEEVKYYLESETELEFC